MSLPTKGWNLIDLPGRNEKRIENSSINKALGVTCDFEDDFTSAIEEDIFPDYVGQEWYQGEVDNEGYFTLLSASTKSLSNYLTGSLRPQSKGDRTLVPYLYLLHLGCGDCARCRDVTNLCRDEYDYY